MEQPGSASPFLRVNFEYESVCTLTKVSYGTRVYFEFGLKSDVV